jgi:uncharacterized protein YdaU (DUF1376 family)
MPQTELDWVPLNIREELYDIRYLSDDSIAAYLRLRNAYFSMGRLPTNDDAIKDIAKLERPRQWPKVMTQLKRSVFNDDWSHPKWGRALASAEGRLADNRRKTAPARAARAANRNPAPEVDPDYEPIPF